MSQSLSLAVPASLSRHSRSGAARAAGEEGQVTDTQTVVSIALHTLIKQEKETLASNASAAAVAVAVEGIK